MSHQLQTKRIYEPASKTDGLRVLADRLWPRGVAKADAKIDVWAKQLAPSHELRKWLHEDHDRYPDFVTKYKVELQEQRAQVDEFLQQHDCPLITLLTATKEISQGHLPVLKAYLERRLKSKK